MKPILTFFLSLLLLVSMPVSAQKTWQPTGVWPFVHKSFMNATIYTGLFRVAKTQTRANIHVGKHSLWYIDKDTLLEAMPGQIIRVEFANGDKYVPVPKTDMLARIVRQDTINGKVARLLCVASVDTRTLDAKYQSVQNLNTMSTNFSFAGQIGESGDNNDIEEQPLPMEDMFYFQVNGETFLNTEKNILNHIDQKRRKEYMNFTRKEEIISHLESSMLKVWNEFFLK